VEFGYPWCGSGMAADRRWKRSCRSRTMNLGRE
jgi:hypothetical protein